MLEILSNAILEDIHYFLEKNMYLCAEERGIQIQLTFESHCQCPKCLRVK